MSASRNLGVRHGRGDFIAFLDADDVWLPQRLETHVALIAVHPKADIVSGPTQLWYGWTGKPQDAVRDGTRAVTQPADRLYQPPELLRSYLSDKALTPATCSVLIRRDAFERIGGFEERFTGMYEDQVFFLKAYLHLPIYLTSVCTDRYRQHPHSHSAEALQTGQYFEDRPGPALVGLFVWLMRYLTSQRVRDRIIWTRLLEKLARIGLNRTMTMVNRPVKRMMTLWYEGSGKGQE